MPPRRACLARLACLALPLGVGLPAQAQQRASMADPLRLGVDKALSDSGLARALLQGFGRDSGIAALPISGPALAMLEALERGELDVALSNAPAAETRLLTLGFAHDRQPVASGEFVIVGPAAEMPRLRAAPSAVPSAAAALTALRDAALAAPGSVGFLSVGDGSGTHLAEQALWRQARIAPSAPWYAAAAAGDLIAQARTRGAWALVERGAWLAQGGAPLAIRVDGDPALAEPIHVMRAFASRHPAGKLFVAWLAGPKGRRVVAAQRGYRVPGA